MKNFLLLTHNLARLCKGCAAQVRHRVAVYISLLHFVIKRIFLFQDKQLRSNEIEQAFFRIVLSGLLFIFLLTTDWLTNKTSPSGVIVALFLMGIYMFFAIIIFWWMHRYHPHKVALRFIMMGLDLSVISTGLYFSQEYGAVSFGIYLWVVLGNGFRYGKLYLYVGTAMCLTGFSIVFALSDYWAAHRIMGVGWIIGLTILPLFVNRLINRLHNLIKEANEARLAADEANRAKSTFFARMSHDLRTPMNGILTATEILRKSQGLSIQHKELFNLIQDSADVSLRQIDNVLDFAKLEAGKLTVNPHPFELQQLIAASMRMISNTAREKKLRLLLTISPQAPKNVIGDAHHLRMVLMNLLTNAAKFTEAGYVALKVEPMAETPESITLRFSIHDTGIGMGPEALAHIWETFRQEHAHLTRRYGGAGLGTTIAKQLVELMGGRISATSTKGQGSLFWFEAPLLRHTSASAIPECALQMQQQVLLLSEDTDWVEALRAVVPPASAKIFAVDTAEDMYAAFARAARFGRSWQWVLVDDQLVRRHGGVRCEAIFMDTAQAVEAPVYLLTDAKYSDSALWERGYCGALPRVGDLAVVTALITMPSPFHTFTEEGPNVVRVAPWVWAGARQSVPKILIADDNYTNRKVIVMVLESAGYAVDAVADGESALQKLESGDYKAIVLDLHMPEMDGVDVMHRYTAMLPGKTRPVVILSSDTTELSKMELAMAGVSAYLTKPTQSNMLLSTLARLIEEQDVVPIVLQDEDTAQADKPPPQVLDMEVLADLERICKNSKELISVVKAFETEADTLMVRITKAVSAQRHKALIDAAQAMKGIAANVGAIRMVQICDRMLALAPQEADVQAAALVEELREAYLVSRNALHEIIGLPQLSRL